MTLNLKPEILKRLEFAIILNEHNRVLHVSHTDLDGYAPQIINKMLLKYNRNAGVNKGIEFMNIEPGELAGTFTDMIKDESYKKYDVIIITDLSFKENDLIEIEKCEELTDRLVLIDHHKNLEYLNTREWAHVIEAVDYSEMYTCYDNTNIEDAGWSAISATELYALYIEHIRNYNPINFRTLPIDEIMHFARIVTLWDTWKWKSLKDPDLAVFVRNWQRLFSWYKYHINCVNIFSEIIELILDPNIFIKEGQAIKGVIDSVKNREKTQYEKFKNGLKATTAKTFDNKVLKIGYCYYKIKDLSGACDYVFDSKDVEFDLIIAIRPDNGLSYRVKPGVDFPAHKLALAVQQLEGVNAGGHPGAAGVSLLPSIIDDIMLHYIDSSLEAISVLQKDK